MDEVKPARAKAQDEDTPCTDCGDTGVTHQTERRCSWQEAEGRDEGAAGERGKSRGQVAYEGWAQGLPGCEWANQTRTQQRAWEKAAQAVIDAHPSPTPAADADRVRKLETVADLADELINRGGLVNRGVDRGLVVVEKADRSDPHYRLCLALADLKSTVAKEGGEL